LGGKRDSSARSELKVERNISHYSIINQLGAGGMGEAYRARDAKLNREVALKLLPAATHCEPRPCAPLFL
jgi:serine/threonine protein kinase